jgi:hypothetical protein
MKDLKLGMPIFATTTCMLDNEIFKLHSTTLKDAFNTSHHKSLQIRLGEGHWGACPTRNREQVCINEAEIKALATSMLADKIVSQSEQEPKSVIYIVKFLNNNLTISSLRKWNEVNSLREGSYIEYRGHYANMRIGNQLPTNVFYTIEGAIDLLSKKGAILFGN